MVQQVKLLFGILVSNVGVLVCVVEPPLQIPINMPGKVVKDDPSPLVLTTHIEASMKVWAPVLTESQLL